MEDKLIISSVLTDLTLASKTKFIEAKDNEELIKLAKSKGIILPSPDLACFETYYCELDKPNLNNAMLTKKAAEEGIGTLVGKQINLNHQGKNYICGYTIDAKIKDNLIVVTGILFKSLFPEEFDEIKQLFEEGKLFVSFELWNREPETGTSIIELMANGIKKITKMIAHGVGLLLTGVKPACKKAQVFKLLANQKDNGELIFQEDERFAYATLNSKEECNQCKQCLCEKEEIKLAEEILIEVEENEFALLEEDYEGGEIEEAKKLKYEERQKLSDDDFAVVVTVKNKVTGEPRKIRMFPIQDEAHVRNALARLPQAAETLKKLGISQEEVLKKILKRAKELNMTELLKKYEKAEEPSAQIIPEPAQVEPPVEVKPEPAQVAEVPVEPRKMIKIITEESVIITEIPDEKGNKVERKGMRKRTCSYSDGTEEVSTEEYNVVDTYTMAQLEEAVNKAKEELTNLHKAELEVKTTEKAELEKKIIEKETEISNLKKELDAKAQEIAELTKPVEKATEQPVVEVGSTEKKEKDSIYKERQKKINKVAYGHE